MSTEPDLSGYSVSVRRGPFGWTWAATAPDGTNVMNQTPSLRWFGTREAAERAALTGIESHAEPVRYLTGEELRAKVRRAQEAEVAA